MSTSFSSEQFFREANNNLNLSKKAGMKLIFVIAMLVGMNNAKSQCATRRVPGDKCAILYLTEDCEDGGSPVDEGWGTVSPAPYTKPKSVVVRPGCKLVQLTDTGK